MSPAKPPLTKSFAKKTSDADINDITTGLKGLTTEGQCYSFDVIDTHKTHLYVKKNHYEVIGEVFMSPIPNHIEVKLRKFGYYVEFSKAYPTLVIDTTHQQGLW